MLHSGKRFRAWRDKNFFIPTLVLSEKKILTETKNHNPPLQVKWSVPNDVFHTFIYIPFQYSKVNRSHQVSTRITI
jgi:hypothetical protein